MTRSQLTTWIGAVIIAAALAIWAVPPRQRQPAEPPADRAKAAVPGEAAVAGSTGVERERARLGRSGGAREVQVRFPNGTKVTVGIRAPHVVSPPMPPPLRLADQYAGLAALALAGDAAAARALYQWLSICSEGGLPESPVTAPQSQADPGGPPTRAVFCDGMTADQVSAAPAWLRQAADTGDYIAQQMWAQRLGATPDATAAWQKFWSDGNTSALPALASLYSQGLGEAADRQPDHFRAYVYKLMYYSILEATTADSSRGNQFMEALLQDLRATAALLSPESTLAAEARAAELLAANASCCVGPH